MKGYTLRGFIKEFRPDGMGHIIVGDSDIEFDEVVCDLCNIEITQSEDEPDKPVVFVEEGWGICQECKEKSNKRGKDR